MSSDTVIAKTNAGDRFQFLDVLRGVAVLAVVVLHNSYFALERNVPVADSVSWPIFKFGNLGVQLFFVISGYCIPGALESALRDPRPMANFLTRRFRRIYPPYWFSLVLSIALALMTMVVSRRSWAEIFPLTIGEWLLNVVLLQGPFHAPDAGLVYWTLTIEVQFYLLMAICILFQRWQSAWLIGLSVAHLLWTCWPSITFRGTPLEYWPEFACGIAAYICHHPQRFWRGTPWWLWGLAMVSILVGVVRSGHLTHAEENFIGATPTTHLFSLVCGILLWQLYKYDWAARRWEVLKPLTGLGIISYSLYLTHVPVGTRIFNLAGNLSLLDGTVFYLTWTVGLAVQIAAACLFYLSCERPWISAASAARRVRPQPVREDLPCNSIGGQQLSPPPVA
jgi:peptidoglycan/LPS O-acetylase OafA/YrhL